MGMARIDQLVPARGSGQLTESWQVMGTVDYMSPEQADNAHAADHRSDIYSLGCTLCRLVTGRSPFHGETVIEVLMAHQQTPVPSLRAIRPEMPAQLDAVFRKMLAKRAEDRYQSMRQVISDLEACAQLVAEPAEPPIVVGTAVGKADRDTSSAVRRLLTVITSQRALSTKTGRRTTLLGAGVAAIAVLVVIGLLLSIIPRGGPQTASKSPQPVPSVPGVPRQTRPAPDDLPSPTRPPSEDRSSPPKSPAEVPQPPDAAYSDAEGKASALVAERRFGEAISVYDERGKATNDATLKAHIDKAISDIQDKARAAYQQVEGRAKQLLSDKKYGEARQALAAVERFGIAEHIEAAKKLAAIINTEETQQRPDKAKAEAERARQAEIQRQREMERRYAEAMAPADAKIAEWDFARAAAALEALQFAEQELADRLAAQRKIVADLAGLKARIIDKINAASPRPTKFTLGIRGIGGDVTSAEEKGMVAEIPKRGPEWMTWSEIGPQEKLIDFASGAANVADRLAGGVLALTCKDTALAEKHFDRARALGADIGPYLGPLVAAALQDAEDMLQKKQYREALKALEDIRKKYPETPWLAANKNRFDAALASAKAGVREEEAEELYTQAVELLKQKELFDLRDLIQKLKTDYAGSSPITDATRKPPFAEMEQAVANLGKRLSVRLDGKGDFKSIQAAINAAEPNTVIEIQDNGPYYERVVIPVTAANISVRGKPGCWPVISNGDAMRAQWDPVVVQAPGTEIARLVIIRYFGGGPGPGSPLEICNACRVRSVIVSGGLQFAIGADCELDGFVVAETAAYRTDYFGPGPIVVRNTMWLPRDKPAVTTNALLENSLFTALRCEGKTTIRSCTIPGQLRLNGADAVVLDSLVGSLTSDTPNHRIENCNVNSVFGSAALGGNCSRDVARFVDTVNFRYGLSPGSPGCGIASDGGDAGCRFTPQMVELLKVALELRSRGLTKF